MLDSSSLALLAAVAAETSSCWRASAGAATGPVALSGDIRSSMRVNRRRLRSSSADSVGASGAPDAGRATDGSAILAENEAVASCGATGGAAGAAAGPLCAVGALCRRSTAPTLLGRLSRR
jgi:hypothetical protein